MTALEALAILAPEVAARADASDLLALAALQMTPSTWGSVYTLALCHLAAHMATLAPTTAAASSASAAVAGPVTAKSTQDRSESYGSATAGVAGMTLGDAALARTRYGLEYLRLRNTRSATMPNFLGPGRATWSDDD